MPVATTQGYLHSDLSKAKRWLSFLQPTPVNVCLVNYCKIITFAPAKRQSGHLQHPELHRGDNDRRWEWEQF